MVPALPLIQRARTGLSHMQEPLLDDAVIRLDTVLVNFNVGCSFPASSSSVSLLLTYFSIFLQDGVVVGHYHRPPVTGKNWPVPWLCPAVSPGSAARLNLAWPFFPQSRAVPRPSFGHVAVVRTGEVPGSQRCCYSRARAACSGLLRVSPLKLSQFVLDSQNSSITNSCHFIDCLLISRAREI